MAILTQVSRKSVKAKCLIASFYVLLTLGGISMVVPFLLMISGSMKGNYNIKHYNLWPRYFNDDVELYRSYTESMYCDIRSYNISNANGFVTIDEATPGELQPKLAQAYRTFLKEQPPPPMERILGHFKVDKNSAKHQLGFIQYLGDTFDGDITRLNKALNTNTPSWSKIVLNQRVLYNRGKLQIESELLQELMTYRLSLKDPELWEPTSDGLFRNAIVQSRFGFTPESISAGTGLSLQESRTVSLDGPGRGNALYQTLRETFLRQFLHPRYIDLQVSEKVTQAHKQYLIQNFNNSLEALQTVYPTATSFDSVNVPASLPVEIQAGVLYSGFIEKMCPLDAFRINDAQTRFRSSLLKTHGNLDAINEQFGEQFKHVSEITIPRATLDWEYVQQNRWDVKSDLITRNFKYVFFYMVSHGRAAFVTVIFCTLSIVMSLLVNPMAAYGLSRYSLPTTYKVLLLLLATMSFPAAVTQIPRFLLIKNLGLLNTFWALILPSMASGYSIFILKGFFDSLPKELYEAASLDGAGEFRMFWVITMNLSKPVLALVALGAFTHAYGAFMFALLLCQDERMWTLMVYLYQLQSESAQCIQFASFILAAIPTFFIFITCQKVIMRGIVVPSEK